MYLSNESGYYLDVSIYREKEDERTGQVVSTCFYGAIFLLIQIFSVHCQQNFLFFCEIILESYGIKQGPLHGLQVKAPYVTKDRLQVSKYDPCSVNK